LTQTCVVGLGVIGGSLLRALHAAGHEVSGIDSDPATCDAVNALGIRAGEAGECSGDDLLRDAEAIVIAVPLPALAAAAANCAALAAGSTVIMHAGSIQSPASIGTESLGARVIGTHPLAGSHDSGFSAATASLYEGVRVHVEERATAGQREMIEHIWRTAGATTFIYAPAAEHDELMAWVSHLPQLCATALASSIAHAGYPPAAAGPGARDTTRLAASSAEIWRGILAASPPATTLALETLERELAAIRSALNANDAVALEQIWERAANWRRGAGAS
jgi:prephenate dehydrogenase